MVEDPLGSGMPALEADAAGNHLCADCIAKYGEPLPAAVNAQLDKLAAKIWPEILLRYSCLCQIKWIVVTDAPEHPGGVNVQ